MCVHYVCVCVCLTTFLCAGQIDALQSQLAQTRADLERTRSEHDRMRRTVDAVESMMATQVYASTVVSVCVSWSWVRDIGLSASVCLIYVCLSVLSVGVRSHSAATTVWRQRPRDRLPEQTYATTDRRLNRLICMWICLCLCVCRTLRRVGGGSRRCRPLPRRPCCSRKECPSLKWYPHFTPPLPLFCSPHPYPPPLAVHTVCAEQGRR